MNEQLRIKIIAGFLVVALIWAGINYNSKDSSPTDKAPQAIQPIENNLQTKVINKNFIDIKKQEDLPWGRSPFYLAKLSTISNQNVITPHNNVLSWTLSGIVFNKSSRTAIINKRPVKVGETIDKAVVTQIDDKKVIIEYNQKEITLTISKG